MADVERRFTIAHLSPLLLVLGVALIVVSFWPLSSLSNRAWTMKDSQYYGKVTSELHQSAFQSAAEAGRTEEEMERYRANLQQEFAKLKTKLEHAQQEPERWSRIFLWSGAALVGVGGLMHISKQSA